MDEPTSEYPPRSCPRCGGIDLPDRRVITTVYNDGDGYYDENDEYDYICNGCDLLYCAWQDKWYTAYEKEDRREENHP